MLKFFLNPNNAAYLRGLEAEFGESSNAIRLELNRLERANMLQSEIAGNRKLFKVNKSHPLFKEINGIVKKYFGLDVIIENIASRLGNLRYVYLTGNIVNGKDDPWLDLLFVGDIDRNYVFELVGKAERLINRKIRFTTYTIEEFEELDFNRDKLLIWDHGQ
ncbi:MAG: ArsR family transcriptional regulator [Cytophagales bacterium]|nr:ArsR family transcriptional regulator [Cytophagales bacterium]